MKSLVIAALLAATVSALPIPKNHTPCRSKQASKTLSPDLPPPSHSFEHQQGFESPRLGKPLQIAVTVKVTPDDKVGEEEEYRPRGADA